MQCLAAAVTVIPQAHTALLSICLDSPVNATSYSNPCSAHNESNLQPAFFFPPFLNSEPYQKEAM